MGVCGKFHKLVVAATLIAYVIALAVPYWSTGEVTGGIQGSFNIGLWKACSSSDPVWLWL